MLRRMSWQRLNPPPPTSREVSLMCRTTISDAMLSIRTMITYRRPVRCSDEEP